MYTVVGAGEDGLEEVEQPADVGEQPVDGAVDPVAERILGTGHHLLAALVPRGVADAGIGLLVAEEADEALPGHDPDERVPSSSTATGAARGR
ncbi:hypothetical protein GCM10023238_10580 [Streptomyces heliomycini]